MVDLQTFSETSCVERKPGIDLIQKSYKEKLTRGHKQEAMMAKSREQVPEMISNMGLFWKADDVFWGQPKNPGSLLGIQANKLKGKKIDFREQMGIYVLYADYRIIYVGQTGRGNQRLFYRLREHLYDDLSERWDRFSWFGTLRVLKSGRLQIEKNAAHPSTDQILNVIEGILIHSAEPPLNRQGGRLKGVTRYLQIRDPRLGNTEREILEDLDKRVKKENSK
jgi:hypothetical protein